MTSHLSRGPNEKLILIVTEPPRPRGESQNVLGVCKVQQEAIMVKERFKNKVRGWRDTRNEVNEGARVRSWRDVWFKTGFLN
jgi:hypothetical protein